MCLDDWPSVTDKVVGFIALAVIILGAWMTVWSENKNQENRSALHKVVLVLLVSEIGYLAYSAAPQAASINGKQAFLLQAIGMVIVGVVYEIVAMIKNRNENPFTQKVTYKQIISGFFFALCSVYIFNFGTAKYERISNRIYFVANISCFGNINRNLVLRT